MFAIHATFIPFLVWIVIVISADFSRAQQNPVIVAEIKGPIGVGTAHFIKECLDIARTDGAELLVLQLDTPGGLVSATRDIIQAMLSSAVPIAVFVGPSGSRAASAGTYIAYAAHFIAMAPGTHIGAATPIQMGLPGMPQSPPPDRSPGNSEESKSNGAMSAAERKMMNDAIAYLRSLAELRHRSAEWAEKFVKDAATLTAEEARKEGIIDVMATDVKDLLDQLNGRKAQTVLGDRIISVSNAQVKDVVPNWRVKFLSAITDPNIVFILLLIGIYGILFEFWSPGLTGPGIVGGISLIVALMGLSALPLSYAGLALLALGIALMAAEAFAPGFGILGIGGLVAFVAGAAFLFDPSGADIDVSIYWPLVLAAAGTSALLLTGLLGMAIRARQKRVVTGGEQLLGSEGKVVDWTKDHGSVRIHGEIWAARSDAALRSEDIVRVTERDGLVLIVEPGKKRNLT